jgi:protein gp37
MADHSKIEWTDATWNPVTGCSIVSPGCTNCYAMRLAGTRLKHHPSRAGLTRDSKAGPVWTGEVRTNWDWIDQPLRWTKPRKIFVCAHGDLFHEGVPDEDVAQIYGVMIAAHHLRGHIFQVLTKRPSRARELLTSEMFWDQAMAGASGEIMDRTDPLNRRSDDARATCGTYDSHNPPPGIWLGVSAEDQARANERVPALLATPADVRFVSAEPLLGPIDFNRIPMPQDEGRECSALDGHEIAGMVGNCVGYIPPLDWIIVGGEAGRGARPMHPEWARQIRDQCSSAGTGFFFKQWGEWKDGSDFAPDYQVVTTDGRVIEADLESLRWADREHSITGLHPTAMRKVGKKRSGRLLDGVEHNAMPRTGR